MTDTSPPRDNAIRLVAVASIVGTTIECYDFLHGTAAALVFNRRDRSLVDPHITAVGDMFLLCDLCALCVRSVFSVSLA